MEVSKETRLVLSSFLSAVENALNVWFSPKQAEVTNE